MASPQKQQTLEDIMDEIRVLRSKVDKPENIVEKRLVGEVKPDKYERKAAAEFERKRKAGKLQFTPLSKNRGKSLVGFYGICREESCQTN